MMTDPRDCPSRCDDCECNVSVEDGREAMLMAFKALEGKDIDAPTNSALNHIHNVVAEREYQRGYKQAKEDCIKAVRDCYENILDVETDGHTIADSVEDIITERVRE